MRSSGVHTGRTASRRGLLTLALLAYLPLLLSQRGRLPADTKLGLTLDPVRLMSDAIRSWDTGQFAGWVPHQSISYLWPSGPFHAALLWLGTPEWITQRLWAGTVLFAAGSGVWWFVRRRGYSPTAAFVAALVYQASPYVLSYISRTSLMLMPWAALGWLLALTDRAADPSRDWKRPTALFGLVVGTAMGINLTAAFMVAPAPLLVLLFHAVERRISWRRFAATLARLGAVSAVASLWWAGMLAMQGRYGAEVLGYSETLEAVSSTASAPEVLRGLGYWLNYIHAPSGVTTSAATAYMESPLLIAVGMASLVGTMATLLLARFRERALAGALLLVGLLLAIGPHPIDDAAPLMSPLASATRSSLALAFRSSTRAIPLVLVAFALCSAALVDSLARTRWSLRTLAAPLLVVLALANLPALFTGALVDPELLHDQRPPAEWYDAAHVLDQQSSETRVLQLPGVESQVFSWGYTVDPPLAMLTDRPLVTRDWLPLGTPAAMDLLYAFDDRFQNDTIDPQAVAPISRLLGVGTVWLALDANADRFGSARPDDVAAVLDAAPDVERTAVDGDHVRLYDIEHPVTIARAATRTVVVFGSGDGVVDAAAAGLLDGTEAILYANDLTDDELATLAAEGVDFLLTDSNRDRARQWRGSQDVWGFTESGGPDDDRLTLDPQDNRLPVFADPRGVDAANQTIATLSEGLTVRASSYGSGISLRPEYRPAMAVDGDPSTAWEVGLDVTPIVGESIQLSSARTGLRLRQIDGGHDITAVRITANGRDDIVQLDARSHRDPGQVVPIASEGPVTVTIVAVVDNMAALADHPLSVAAGFSEMLPEAHAETVRTPSLRGDMNGDAPVSVVLTRLRTARQGRADVESVLRRQFATPTIGAPQWRVQVHPHEPAAIATGCRDDLLVVDGDPLPLQVDADAAAALSAGDSVWLTPCTAPEFLGTGWHMVESNAGVDSGLDVDAVVVRPPSGAATVTAAAAPAVTIDRHVDDHTVKIANCPVGCWVVFGEGFSTGWSASSSDATVGVHRPVSGGFNGWWVEPAADGVATLHLHWAAQRPVMLALALSTLGALALLVLALLPARSRREAFGAGPRRRKPQRGWIRETRAGAASVAVVALAVSPRWGALVAVLAALAALVASAGRRVRGRSRRVSGAVARLGVALVGLALVALAAAMFVLRSSSRHYPADFAWPTRFETLHRPMLAGVLLVAIAAITGGSHRSRPHTDD